MVQEEQPGPDIARENLNGTLLGWTVSLLAIFYSVWWALFINELIEAQATRLDTSWLSLDLWKGIAVAAAAVLIGFFAWRNVHWLKWVRQQSPASPVGSVVKRGLWPQLLALVFLETLIVIAAVAFKLDGVSVVYGSTLLLTWLFTPPAIVML